jgi:hypothetical protein
MSDFQFLAWISSADQGHGKGGWKIAFDLAFRELEAFAQFDQTWMKIPEAN